jgi:hypothetical protein
LPPVLQFDYETVMDGRSFSAPGQLRAAAHRPAEGRDRRSQAPALRHHRSARRARPGIGGFKDDSQVGIALREGHPVYFVDVLPESRPGRRCSTCAMPSASSCITCAKLHPDAPKPGIVGNCQAGWAAMMLAAANPDDTGPS